MRELSPSVAAAARPTLTTLERTLGSLQDLLPQLHYPPPAISDMLAENRRLWAESDAEKLALLESARKLAAAEQTQDKLMERLRSLRPAHEVEAAVPPSAAAAAIARRRELEEQERRVAALFGEIDANKDGKVSLQELYEAVQQRDEVLALFPMEQVQRLFKQADADDDDALSRDEYGSIVHVLMSAAAGASPAPKRKTSEWLKATGALAALTNAIDFFCGGDYEAALPRLRDVGAVQGVVEGCARRAAALISDAAAALTLQTEPPFSLETIADSKTRTLFAEALAKDREPGGQEKCAGAKHVFAPDGLPPWMWGVSKPQFAAFIGEVRAAHAAGKIQNQPDESKSFYYQRSKV